MFRLITLGDGSFAWKPLAALLLAACATAPCLAQTEHQQPAEQQSPASAEKPSEQAGFPAFPAIELAVPNGFASESAYQQSVVARSAELVANAAQISDPLPRAETLLAAANHSLAHGLEPVCTRRLLQLSEVVDPAAQDDEIGLIVSEAKDAIKKAVSTLDESEEASDPNAADDSEPREDDDAAAAAAELANERYALRQQAERLLAFAGAMESYLSDPGAEKSGGDSLRAAASGLSPLLESEDQRVATAALFWQSILRTPDDDPQALLSRLDFVNAPMRSGVDPYSLWGRTHRCRVLAQHEPPPVALALLLQLEERCFDWFTDEAERDRALGAVALVRLQILRAWYDSLDPSEAAQERSWCANEARRIVQDRFADDNHTVMRLAPCIPILVLPPKPTPNVGH